MGNMERIAFITKSQKNDGKGSVWEEYTRTDIARYTIL